MMTARPAEFAVIAAINSATLLLRAAKSSGSVPASACQLYISISTPGRIVCRAHA
jgi:hypothetical protein